MSFLPGEPLPPGFEEEDMSHTAIIESQIESYSDGPLIGTEYVIELQTSDQLNPDYFCVLCNTCNDHRSIFIHWTSFGHRNKYIQKHFKKAYEQLQVLKRGNTNSGELIIAVENLTQLVEKHLGRRGQVLISPNDDFRRFRAKICAQVRDKFHPDETTGPDFVKEARQVVQDLKSKDSGKNNIMSKERERESGTVIALDAISSDDDASFGPTGGSSEGGKSNAMKQAKKSRKKHQLDEQTAYRAHNRSSPTQSKTIVPTPKELSMQASFIAQERYKWEKFRCMLELQLKQLCDETETYEFNPEKHPDYPDEWKQFWNRRYKQLQEEKKCDPNRYDYKPEWITYWKDRRVELFNIAVNKIKKELKDKFKLGDEDEEKTKELMERYKIRVSSPHVNGPAALGNTAGPVVRRNFRSNRPQVSETVIDISDDEQQPANPPQGRRQNRPNYPRSRSHSMSPKHGGGRHRSRRSRSRSPMSSRRDYRNRRSGTMSPQRHSRSPTYARHRGDRGDRGSARLSRERTNSNISRSREDYSDRDRRSVERDFYRSDSYTRSSRSYEPRETFRVLDSRVYPEYNQPQGRSDSPGASKDASGSKEVAGKDQSAIKGNATSTEPEPAADEGPLTVISVLRMLSAVEEHLGSLGPKALNLLSKALAMEIIQPNAADDLLLNDDNCVFLETTKEKLKGILIAEVLDDPQKVRVVKKLITNIAAIIFQVTSRGATESAEASKIAEQEKHKRKTTRDYQLPYDRNIVSTKLASALVLKGYTDVTTEDMNKMLHFFTLLVKLDQEKGHEELTLKEVEMGLGLKFSAKLPSSGTSSVVKNTSDLKAKPSSLGIDLDELMKEVEHQLNRESVDALPGTKMNEGKLGNTNATVTTGSSSNGMELLTDSDLQTLLQNFKFLSTEEQVHLIGHLRKLEVQEPIRVRRLRKYVNLGDASGNNEPCSDVLSRMVTNDEVVASNVSLKPSRNNLSSSMGARRRKSSEQELPILMGKQLRRDCGGPGERNSPKFMLDDDEDDDYNFDDLVMKACDSNGDRNMGKRSGPQIVPVESSPNALTFKPAAASSSSVPLSSSSMSKISLKETESIIANLMGTLSNNSSQSLKNQQQQHHHQSTNNERAPVGPSFGSAGSMPPRVQQQQQPSSNPASFGVGGGSGGGGSAAASGGGPRLNPMNSNSTQAGIYPRNYPQNSLIVNASTGPDPGPYSGPNIQPYGGYGGGPNPNMPQQNYPPGPYGGGNQIGAWGNNGPPQPPPPYNIPQNYVPQQQQQQPPHYNNIYRGQRH